MRALSFLSLVVVVSLGACRDRAVLGANGELRAQPERIDFPSAWVGHRATAVVTLENAGRRSIEVALTTSARSSSTPRGSSRAVTQRSSR